MVVNPEDSFSHIKVHKMVFCYRCVEQVKNSQYIDLAHDLEIDKAIMLSIIGVWNKWRTLST